MSYTTLFHSHCRYYCGNIRILWKYPRSMDIICILWKYPRSVDIICILCMYPYLVEIIPISWKYPRSVDNRYFVEISMFRGYYPYFMDFIRISCIYPYFMDIIRISCKYPRSLDIIRNSSVLSLIFYPSNKSDWCSVGIKYFEIRCKFSA